jgi:alpha-tubulin suppressor-like RCC1 family protein
MAGQFGVPPKGTDAVCLSAGIDHALALKADGTVAAWGDQRERVPAGLKDLVAIPASGYSLALKADGTVLVRSLAWPVGECPEHGEHN